jgi:CheY-like chemotaxis protein
MSARILIVEDDPLAQEFIKIVLESRGYEVDATSDGFEAVQLLNKGNYDLALVDYQLPEIDGYVSARMMRSVTEASRPKLLAVTANAAELRSRTGVGEVFDEIISKPLDVNGLLRLVEQSLHNPQRIRLVEESTKLWRGLGLERRPLAKVVPEPSRAQAIALEPLFELTDGPGADLILLTDGAAASGLCEARAMGDAFLLPVVELGELVTGIADATFDVGRRETWGELASTVRRFADKRPRLSDGVRYSTDIDTRLLAYLFMSGRSFQPIVDPSRPSCARHPGFFPETAVVGAAERLAHRGLLSRQFVDRFHRCSACESHRLNVREECPGCRSANLRQADLIHHFRCAHQAPEDHFKSGAHLVCPKCSQQLCHYGGDYEKPGSLMVCDDCGAWNSDPAIGFSCLDCGKHMDGDAADKRDLFSYSLTERAIALLTGPVQKLTLAPGRSLTQLPPPVTEALERVVEEGRGALSSLSIIEVRYAARSGILDRQGPTAFAKLRRLFVENMLNALAACTCLVPYGNLDYLIVSAEEIAAVGGFAQAMLDHCQASLSHDLDPSIRIIQAEDAVAAA